MLAVIFDRAGVLICPLVSVDVFVFIFVDVFGLGGVLARFIERFVLAVLFCFFISPVFIAPPSCVLCDGTAVRTVVVAPAASSSCLQTCDATYREC